MWGLRRLSPALGVGVVGLAIGLAIWPLNEPGVTGSAFAPHYRGFGWYSFSPLPAHPTNDDLRRAGIPVPYDAVHRRRVEAAGTLSVGLAGAAFPWLTRRPRVRRRWTRTSRP